MVIGFKGAYDASKKYSVPMREGALAVAVGRVAEAIKTLGQWP